MLETALDRELGKRLERVYKLSRRPETLVELQALFREKRNNPAVEVYLERVRSGAGVIGASSGPTSYRNVLAEGDVDVMCGYDALMNALLRGAGVVQASCVHCGEAMVFDLRDHDLTRQSTPELLFWLGTGPIGAPGNPVCDHLHLFPDRTHLDGWLEGNPDELGAALPIVEAIAFFADHPIPPSFARKAFDDR